MPEKRIKKLNTLLADNQKPYVFYIVEASHRTLNNHALEFAIYRANQLQKPLVVVFPLTDKFKWSNQRYYSFMIDGIVEMRENLKQRGIPFRVFKNTYLETAKQINNLAASVVTDCSYLKTQRQWRYQTAQLLDCEMFQVETDVVVPVELVSDHKEPYAATFRPKVLKLLSTFLNDFKSFDLKHSVINPDLPDFYHIKTQNYIDNLNIDKSVSLVSDYFRGGTSQAIEHLNLFISKKLDKYKELRSDPSVDFQSSLSPYLHFGQISPQFIINRILEHTSLEDPNVETLINEMVVWRELARNFCYYNPHYNSYEGIPQWAKDTLMQHSSDIRAYIYTLVTLENAQTHDRYWNAAQKELLLTGKMHNYMRMYWAKKLIEWTTTPQEAFDIACYLNDKYQLDGRDPNGYAAISWCFGTHDRPWAERPIFGKIRYMNDKGLERKFDIEKYVSKYNTFKSES